jgi:hypothetical protein
MTSDSGLSDLMESSRNLGYLAGKLDERARCISISSRDVEVVDRVSGIKLMVKPNCSCAKDIAGER